MKSLELLDFEWQVQVFTWEVRCQLLVAFKGKFDRMNVPQSYTESKPLGTWVMNERIQYKLFKANQKIFMTRERIQSLELLDYEWQLKTRSPT